ncbi:PREDICTED: uncharacterized protein LOC109230036 [Nicotiana attenuata]|uniref:uncharacterized protein LOC109230036 n=1 Tax=Nicotiana attenuata TaxID=49451 RepID=UPI0009059085|nr:PREDICTED: uncharacterized protein LOC109230036 [Nicotiana attenuata]
MGGERAMVAVEGSTLEETIGPSREEPDPSSEETGQGSHSQASSAPAFVVDPLNIQVPEMSSSDEEDQDNIPLDAFIAKRRVVSYPESSTKRSTTRLQAKVAYDSSLQNSRKTSKKKKRRLVKDNVIVCDKVVPVERVEEEITEEPSSLVRRSHKKKQSASVDNVTTPNSKLKDVVSEPSISDEDVLVKSKGKAKSNGMKSGKRKLEPVKEPVSTKKMRSETSSASKLLRHQKVRRTFDPANWDMAGMRQVLAMVEFQW